MSIWDIKDQNDSVTISFSHEGVVSDKVFTFKKDWLFKQADEYVKAHHDDLKNLPPEEREEIEDDTDFDVIVDNVEEVFFPKDDIIKELTWDDNYRIGYFLAGLWMGRKSSK